MKNAFFLSFLLTKISCLILCTVFKIHMIILNTMMEGTVSQILDFII